MLRNTFEVTFERQNQVPQGHGHGKTHPRADPRSRHAFHGTRSVPVSPEHGRLVSRQQQSSANGSHQSAEEPGDADLTAEVPLCVCTSVCWFPVWSERRCPNEVRSRLLSNSPAPYLHRKDYFFFGGGGEADTKYFLSFLP